MYSMDVLYLIGTVGVQSGFEFPKRFVVDIVLLKNPGLLMFFMEQIVFFHTHVRIDPANTDFTIVTLSLLC